MKLLQTTAIVLGATLAAPAAHAAPMVSDVEVRTDLSDYANSNALDYWPDLAEDLGRAIVERVELTSDAKDPSITVEVSKIAVDDNPVLAETGMFNQLVGVVQVYPGDSELTDGKNQRGTDEPIQNYPLLMHARTGDPIEGWVTVPPSQDDFYTAMINAYASEIVKNLDQ